MGWLAVDFEGMGPGSSSVHYKSGGQAVHQEAVQCSIGGVSVLWIWTIRRQEADAKHHRSV